jgi:GT2 family glycosyltransferase
MQPESQPPAPAVVAVVVTCDPGSWFEQVLASLAAQDYPNLSVLVVDAGSVGDPTERVAGVLPGAYVRRMNVRAGFGTAANEVLSLVEGASHLLICHDDVALDPDAVRLLVEEAFRSNAGIVTPKFVAWEDPDRLLAVGATTDKAGVLHQLVEPGELDQQQHDAVREVMIAPGGATLIRADLFAALGGYDPAVDQFGEDLDLSWRARVAGARVATVPAARVRHYQAFARGERPRWASSAARRRAAGAAEAHRIRTVLTCYRWFDLLWILPLAWAWSAGEAATSAAQGRMSEAGQVLWALVASWANPPQLWRSRRRVQRNRGARDSEIWRLQTRGNARFRSFVRARFEDVRVPHGALPGRLGRTGYEDADDEEITGRVVVGAADRADRAGRPARRYSTTAIIVLFGVLVFGSRSLLGHDLPAVGRIPDASTSWAGLWRAWWSNWQPTGLGVAAPSSPALGLLGLLGTALFGAVGTLQHVVVLAPLLVGPLGAYRAARWWRSQRGRLVALVAYAVVALPYNSLAGGHWGGLVAYGATPWVLGSLCRLSGEVPYPNVAASPAASRVVALGAVTAVVACVAPSYLFVEALAGVWLLGGSLLSGSVGRGVRTVGVSVAAAVVGAVLLFPWSASTLTSEVSVLGPSDGAAGRLGLGQVMRFHTGPFGGGEIGFALLVVAALPLLIGRGWRLAWAARFWVLALASFAMAWAGSRGWVPALPVDVVLAPAAAALAGSAALGVVAFELDLPGYRFGWRQLTAGVAALALAAACVPFLMASAGGRWRLPSADASSVLAFLPGARSGDYRVLWVGYPDAIPLAGRQLEPGVAYATSLDGEPTTTDQWVSAQPGAAPQIAADLRLVQDGLTTKLGHLLSPAAVRYVVVPNHDGPSGSGAESEPVPGQLLAGLAAQTDLESLDVGDPNYSVFENSVWAPARSVLPASALASVLGPPGDRALQDLDLAGAAPVLTGPAESTRGSVPAGATVYLAYTRSDSWRLQVSGASVPPAPAFGWAMAFDVPAAAGAHASGTVTVPAVLAYRTPLLSRIAQLAGVLAWVVALAIVVLGKRRRSVPSASPEAVDPDWFAPMAAVRDERRRRRAGGHSAPRRRPAGAAERGSAASGDPDGDEVWLDV